MVVSIYTWGGKSFENFHDMRKQRRNLSGEPFLSHGCFLSLTTRCPFANRYWAQDFFCWLLGISWVNINPNCSLLNKLLHIEVFSKCKIQARPNIPSTVGPAGGSSLQIQIVSQGHEENLESLSLGSWPHWGKSWHAAFTCPGGFPELLNGSTGVVRKKPEGSIQYLGTVEYV